MVYTSLDGRELFCLVKLLSAPVYFPLRVNFAFPNGSLGSFKFKIWLTGKAILEFNSSKAVYQENSIIFPKLVLTVLGWPFISAENSAIGSPDQVFLTFSTNRFVVDHDHLFIVGEVFSELMVGWHLVKPLIDFDINRVTVGCAVVREPVRGFTVPLASLSRAFSDCSGLSPRERRSVQGRLRVRRPCDDPVPRFRIGAPGGSCWVCIIDCGAARRPRTGSDPLR
jgi:hypothetical protein